jgi:anti-sigma-K factor RskA
MTEHPTEDLGLYALGLLDPGERIAIERHLATCDTCRADLATHRSTLNALRQDVGIVAPADLHDRIVTRHRRGPGLSLPVFAYAASALLAVALVVSLAALSQERAMRDDYARALSAVAGGARVVSLDAKGNADVRGAVVLSREGTAYLVLQLPTPPAGKAYEAWVIRGGVATAAGMAPVLTGVITMQLHDPLRPGDATAITLEDAPGAQQPTTTPVLIGQV